MIDSSQKMRCTVAELMIFQIAQSIEDGILAFHGFGSPLVQLALHLAKHTHAPNLILVAGATYGVNPSPRFLTPTSNDWAMDRQSECHLGIEELFDLAASGRMGRMFLSGLQIDKWGNMNVTQLGARMPSLKLPGGGGGCNLSCDVSRLTIWTSAHRTSVDSSGRRRYRLVEKCDFVTSLGHRAVSGETRTSMGLQGSGPDRLVTELGVFDFQNNGQARLISIYPDTDIELIAQHTEFEFSIRNSVTIADMPDASMLEIIRRLDPLKIHTRELRAEDRTRRFEI